MCGSETSTISQPASFSQSTPWAHRASISARHAVDAVFLRHADAQALDRLADEAGEVGNLDRQAGRVLGVVAAHRPAAGWRRPRPSWPAARPGRARRRRPRRPSASSGRRSASSRPCRSGRRAGGSSRRCRWPSRPAPGRPPPPPPSRRTSRRASAARFEPARAPGIDHRPEGAGLVGRAHGELVHVELAQHHRPVAPEVGGDGGLVGRREVAEDPRAGGGCARPRCRRGP